MKYQEEPHRASTRTQSARLTIKILTALALGLLAWSGISARADEPLCTPVPSGIRVWFPFNNDATDVVSGSNAVLSGSPVFVPGQAGQALRFDGFDDAARFAARAALDIGIGSGLTAEMWIRPESVQSPAALLEWSDAVATLGAHFYLASSSPGSLFANLIDTNGNAHSFGTASGLVVTGQWQHVALTYSRSLTSGVARIYFNGTGGGLVADAHLPPAPAR